MNLARLLQQAVGEDLAGDDLTRLTDLAYEHLEARVGEELTARLTDQQVLDFEAAQKDGDEAGSQWLDRHCPDHPQVVVRCMDRLLDEIGAQVRRADVRYRRDSTRPV